MDVLVFFEEFYEHGKFDASCIALIPNKNNAFNIRDFLAY